MKRARLGKSGITIGRYALGTANFGVVTPPEEAAAILDRAVDMGIDFIDTADSYGGQLDSGRGSSEEILGKWLAADPARREKLVIATKVFPPTGRGPNDRGLSAHHVRRACEASLRRLRTDHIDLYQMHHVDRSVGWEEIWQAMEVLVREGKVLYVGSSNFAGWHIAHASCVANDRHVLGLVSEQSPYHLANRTVELEVLPACEAFEVGFLAWSPLGGGLLAGSERVATGGRRDEERVRRSLEQHRDALRDYAALCRELREDPATIALAWLLGRPAVTGVILGPRTVDQLLSTRHAMAVDLTSEQQARLDAIWPGPGGPAPEAYAW